MTQNLRTEQDKKKSGSCTPHTVLNWGICKFVSSAIQWTFDHFPLLYSKPHSNSSNALDTFELHATLLMPNLARYSHVHAGELHKILPCFGPKDSVLYSCLHSSTTMTKFNIAESWMAWQWVNNATDPATATQLNLNWEANKTHLHNVKYGNNPIWHHLLSNHWHKTLTSRLLEMYPV